MKYKKWLSECINYAYRSKAVRKDVEKYAGHFRDSLLSINKRILNLENPEEPTLVELAKRGHEAREKFIKGIQDAVTRIDDAIKRRDGNIVSSTYSMPECSGPLEELYQIERAVLKLIPQEKMWSEKFLQEEAKSYDEVRDFLQQQHSTMEDFRREYLQRLESDYVHTRQAALRACVAELNFDQFKQSSAEYKAFRKIRLELCELALKRAKKGDLQEEDQKRLVQKFTELIEQEEALQKDGRTQDKG